MNYSVKGMNERFGVSKKEIAAFKQYLNETHPIDTVAPQGEARYGRMPRKRLYGDYLYAQDRELFLIDLMGWKKAHG